MKLVCFGGSAAVADDAGDGEAVVARHRSRRRGLSTLRRKFLSGDKGKKSAAAAAVLLPEAKRSPGREVEDVYDMIVGAGKSSSARSSSASLDSACTSSSCSSSLSSSSSFLEVMPPPVKRPEKRSPAAAAAAVVVCLVLMMLCGRVGATLLTSTALYFFPRRWPARANAGSAVEDGAESPEYDAASAREEETMKRKVVMEGFLVRNRKK